MSLLSTNLAFRLVQGSLPWDCATPFHIHDFLQTYTLHDSHWITLHLPCAWEDSAIAVISFDPVWNPTVSTPASLCADWPLLFLRFTLTSSIQMAGYGDIGGLQRGISSASSERISDEEAVTAILDHYGASVQVRHFPVIDALVMSSTDKVIPLPKHET